MSKRTGDWSFLQNHITLVYCYKTLTDNMLRVLRNLYICVGSEKDITINIISNLFLRERFTYHRYLSNLLSNACKNNSWSACKWSIFEFLFVSLSLSRFLGGISGFLFNKLAKPPSSSVRWLDSKRQVLKWRDGCNVIKSYSDIRKGILKMLLNYFQQFWLLNNDYF